MAEETGYPKENISQIPQSGEITAGDTAESPAPAVSVGPLPDENPLYIRREDYTGWIIGILICLAVFISFHDPFRWMLFQWFRVETYSPGPLVPILILIIIWSLLKRNKNVPYFPRNALYIAGGVAVALGAITYFAKDNSRLYPQYEIFADISFDILFFVLTLFLLYAGYLFSRQERLNPTEQCQRDFTMVGWGVAFLIGGLLLHFLGMRGDEKRLSILGFIGVMFGLTWFLFGRGVGKKMFFVYAFLLFIVPMDFLDDYLGGPLRVIATNISVGIMKPVGSLIGMEVVQFATTFEVNGDPFDVAPACSGLRSLVALSAIGAAYAFITQPTMLRKWLLGLCAIPIAVVTNIIRLIMVGFTSHFFGSKWAVWVHDNAIVLYVFAIILLFSLDKIFDRISKSRFLNDGLKWLKIKDF